MNPRPRRTLAAPSEVLSGIGLHSGKPTAIRLLPAASGTGVRLRDLDTEQEIPALASNVVDTSRCTVLGAQGVTIQTVEHLLSALSAAGLDDVLVETRGGELPALDGSAAGFLSLLRDTGSVELEDEVTPFSLSNPRMLWAEDGSSLIALPSSAFHATVVLDYPKHPWIGTQAVEYDAQRDDYASEIAPARTYGFLTEIAWLQQRGLALGASRETGIALREDGYDTALRFDDELARHKLLDLIGDLSLIGRPFAARVIAVKPSHTLNCRFARLLAEDTA